MIKILIIFTIVQLVNVILNTIKSIVTIKGTKFWASVINAITYGFYTIVVVLTASEEMSLGWKISLTIATNLIGVYFGLWVLEKIRKDRLWEITATLGELKYYNDFKNELIKNNISFNDIALPNEQVFHIYSYSQQESNAIKPILQKYNAKYIVHEETVRL